MDQMGYQANLNPAPEMEVQKEEGFNVQQPMAPDQMKEKVLEQDYSSLQQHVEVEVDPSKQQIDTDTSDNQKAAG